MRTTRCTAATLEDLVHEDMRRLKDRVQIVGLGGAAIDGAHVVAKNAPVAFEGLRASVHADLTEMLAGKTRIVVDAPWAGAVEKGSRPHTPPLAPLIAWVKLRGMQGLTKTGKVRSPKARAWGSTTAASAHVIASQLKEMQGALYGANAVDAPEQIARRIQASIRKHGTKPQWFVRSSLPKIRAALHDRMKKAVHG